MKFILNLHDKMRPLFEKGGKLEKIGPIFEAADTFTFTPDAVTADGAHVRDAVDMKRLMMTVIYAVVPCFIFGIWNAGHQFNIAHAGAPVGFIADMIRGAIIVIPIVFVSYAVGGFWEVLFSCVRKHEINEGLLVTGILFPLVLPPTIPLWQVAAGITFGIVIGKEVFGGTGMNIVNPALLSRAFIFFAYAKSMTGDVWIARSADMPVIDGITSATPLGIASSLTGSSTVAEAISQGDISFIDAVIGNIPGSIGETSAVACVFGAVVLLAAGVASWRIMLSCVLGLLATAFAANIIGSSPISQLPPHYHLVTGGFMFGAVFMATDPVSAAATKVGKWIYGFLIGVLVIVVRVANTGFPEGVMLSILFMNLMAPLIDNFVVEAHIRRRSRRA